MKKLLYIIVTILFIPLDLFGQYIWGPTQTDYRRDLWQYQSQVYAHDLGEINTLYPVGRESGPTIKRDVYQWDIPDGEIPDNSIINNVRLEFDYSDGSSSSDLYAKFYKISYDMKSENYFSEIFDEMDYTINPIGSKTGTDHHITFTSSDPNAAFNMAIKDMLPNNKFVLGIKWGNDESNYNNTWNINNWSLTLYIEFNPPTKLVNIDQRNSINNQIGVLKKWEYLNTPPSWSDEFNPDTQFPFVMSSAQTIQGDQTLISNEKYNNWNGLNDVTNHHSFTIDENTDILCSYFKPAKSGIIIQNALEGSSATGGTIKFADPWYIDFPDPHFGDSPRNRGMDNQGADALRFRQRNSPFYPDYNTIFQNELDPAHSYQGVFLNETPDPNDPSKPYYSVQSVVSQSIPMGGRLGTRNYQFIRWSGMDVQLTADYDFCYESGVVFTNNNAIVNAELKGHLLSNDQQTLSTGSQRRLVRTANGIYHLCYESMGWIWYIYSLTTNFNGAWSEEQYIWGKNPSLEFKVITY